MDNDQSQTLIDAVRTLTEEVRQLRADQAVYFDVLVWLAADQDLPEGLRLPEPGASKLAWFGKLQRKLALPVGEPLQRLKLPNDGQGVIGFGKRGATVIDE